MTSFIMSPWICVLALMLTSQSCHGGSVLTFTATPDVIKQGLTRNLTLRCEVAENQARSGSTDEDIVSVANYWVTYGEDEHVASVDTNEMAKGFIDEGNLRVSGSASGMGYLELTWDQPAATRLGTYQCHVIAKSKRNTIVQLKKSFRLSSEDASVADLLERINQNEDEVMQLMEKQVSCLSQQVGFTATLAKYGNTYVKGGQTVIYDKVISNIGNAYNPGNGRFTATSPGMYAFTVTAYIRNTKEYNNLNIKVNEEIVTSEMTYNGSDDYHNSASARAVVQLSAGDVVTVEADDSHDTHTMSYQWSDTSINLNTFSGELIQPDCAQ